MLRLIATDWDFLFNVLNNSPEEYNTFLYGQQKRLLKSDAEELMIEDNKDELEVIKVRSSMKVEKEKALLT